MDGEVLLTSYRRLKDRLTQSIQRLHQELEEQRRMAEKQHREDQWAIRKLAEENALLQQYCTEYKVREGELRELETRIEEHRTSTGARASLERPELVVEDRGALEEMSARVQDVEKAYTELSQQHKQLQLAYQQLEEDFESYKSSHRQAEQNMHSMVTYLEQQLADAHNDKQKLELDRAELRQTIEHEQKDFDSELKRYHTLLTAQVELNNELKRENFRLTQQPRQTSDDASSMTAVANSVPSPLRSSPTSVSSRPPVWTANGDVQQTELVKLRQENEALRQQINQKTLEEKLVLPTDNLNGKQINRLQLHDLQNRCRELEGRLRETEIRFENQFKINKKIKKLFLQAVNLGVPPPRDTPLDIPDKVKQELQQQDLIDNLDSPFQPLPAVSSSSQGVSTSNSPAAVKNHIQLIDLYNSALKTIARLQLESENRKAAKTTEISHHTSRSDISSVDVRVRDLEEERDAWKDNTRRLEKEIWDLQQKLKQMTEPPLVVMHKEDLEDHRSLASFMDRDDTATPKTEARTDSRHFDFRSIADRSASVLLDF